MMSHMCDLRGLNHDWRWFISSTPNFSSLHVVKHWLRIFGGHRLRGWFNNMVFSKYNHCLQLFKTRVLCPPGMSLQFFVTLFPNLSMDKLVKL